MSLRVLIALLCVATSASADPILVRSIYNGQLDLIGDGPPEAVATGIDSMNPADCYVVGVAQFDEAVVEVLRQRGKRIIRYINPTTVRVESGQRPRPVWRRTLYDAFVPRGYILTDVNGDTLRYRWFGRPYIIRWDLVDSDLIDDLVTRLAFVRGDVWELDCWFSRLSPWMLERHEEFTQERMEGLYNRAMYCHRRDEFLEALRANARGVERNRTMLLNDPAPHPSYDAGELVFFENAQYKDWDTMFQQWRARPGCVLEIRSPPMTDAAATIALVWARAVEAVAAWLEDGKESDSWLWVDNGTVESTAMHLYARYLQERNR